MITKNEVASLSLSPTKKDFVQIWNELLEVTGKLSERWDPTSTNESDPGIVILKALTGIADKLNYNIDKNTLEAFMPTAAQEDSMRKLCDMLGYNVKYYQSAITDVTIKYYNADPSEKESVVMDQGLIIPKFTVITNNDKDISYFTLDTPENRYRQAISSSASSVTLTCMEGQVVKCESINDNSVITANQISEDNRFYLPETRIAENGVFVYNALGSSVSGLIDGAMWEKVDNLNTQPRASRKFKFGFDSYEGRPYLEFPEDYSELFGDGIFIYYTRTSGANGNVSPRTLTQVELPSGTGWSDVSSESFSAENIFSATNGSEIETIKQAYNNFKKTVGTFETLVTCRDYMNKIYSMTDDSGKPYVSNILVTDIRNDLNRAITICSCDDAGIFYKETPLVDTEQTCEISLTDVDGNEIVGFVGKQAIPIGSTPAIDHFDLVFYPFKSYKRITNSVKDIRAAYNSSFDCVPGLVEALDSRLSDCKTIAHKVKRPRTCSESHEGFGDVVSINNYLRLNATIATNSKITSEEGKLLIEKIKIALANAFNMHELDFGEEIPFDSIVEVIEQADSRIRVASVNEPVLYTTFSVLEKYEEGTPKIVEYPVDIEWLNKEDDEDEADKAKKLTTKKIYNKLALRNLLAGRVSLFDYNDTFRTDFSESAYLVETKVEATEAPKELLESEPEEPFTIWAEGDTVFTRQLHPNEDPIYTKIAPKYENNIITSVGKDSISDIEAKCEVAVVEGDDGKRIVSDLILDQNEHIKFRAPNFITTKTYPAYVNYHLDLGTNLQSEAKPAEAVSLFSILDADRKDWSSENPNIRWERALQYFKNLTNSASAESYVKEFTISQRVSGLTEITCNNSSGHVVKDGECIHCGALIQNSSTNGVEKGVNLDVENTDADSQDYTSSELLAKSGCVKLVNTTATLSWASDDKAEFKSDLPPITVGDSFNPYITNIAVIADIQDAVDRAIKDILNSNSELLPTSDWIVSFKFECVPLEPRSLTAWESYIKSCAEKGSNYEYQVLDFKPKFDNDLVFWRLFGEGYELGKLVTEDTQKLLKFTSSYFGLLPESVLTGIHLVKFIGSDASPTIIKNNEEYELRNNEYLYIEYTPSTTSSEGATQELAAITEIHGPGTIIRPSGFEAGLVDSSTLGSTSYKSVTFMQNGGPISVNMYSLGASEQIEIRDYAKVTLTKDTFSSAFIYKNFSCDELEKSYKDDNGQRVNNKYTLKDGEYIFYTDKNKSELAYYSTGTQVVLNGNLTLKQCDTIDLNDIFESSSGIQDIPWVDLELSKGSIEFQEYQYISLGANDTLKELELISNGDKLSSAWRYCDNVAYTLADDEDNITTLPSVNVRTDNKDSGNGWEVCSTLDLNISPSHAQNLRTTDKIRTWLELRGVNTGDNNNEDKPVIIEAQAPSSIEGLAAEHQVSAKVNLSCRVGGSKINIDDVYLNPKELEGFTVKVFTSDTPSIVETVESKVIPYNSSVNFASWVGTPIQTKGIQDLWNSVKLSDLQFDTSIEDGDGKDKALKLSVSLLPDTYGVFCVYLKYASELDPSKIKTRIEVVPGTRGKDIMLLTDSINQDSLESANSLITELQLHPGINCIRVNKTCQLFIKTSDNAMGTLYFDDLRLVNCSAVKYKYNDVEYTLPTYGFNLEQLGYFSTSGSNDLSPELQTQLKSNIINKADSEIDILSDKMNAELQVLGSKISDGKDKISNIALALSTALDELNKLSSNNLTRSYLDIYTERHHKKALLEALSNNRSGEALEQKLIDLADKLESHNSFESSQKKLLSEIDEFNLQSADTLKAFSDTDVLYDFKATYPQPLLVEDDVQSQLISKLYKSDFEKITSYYNDQLTDLVARIRQIETSDTQTSLLALVDSAQSLQLVNEQLAKIKYLVEAAASDEIDSLLSSAETNALEANHTTLRQIISQLDILVRKGDFGLLLAELEQVDNTTLIYGSQFENLVNNLYKELDLAIPGVIPEVSTTETVVEANRRMLLSDIDELLESLKTKNDGTQDASVVTAVRDIREGYQTLHTLHLREILAEMKNSINSMYDSNKQEIAYIAKNTLDSLDIHKDAQTRALLNELSAILVSYNAKIQTLDDFLQNGNYDIVGEDAIVSIWSDELLLSRLNDLEPLCSVIREATKIDERRFLKFDDLDYAYPIISKLSLSDRELLKHIVSQQNTLLANYDQRTALETLIEQLGDVVPLPDDVYRAMTNITSVGSGRCDVLIGLIASLQNADSTPRKQQLRQMLKTELDFAIQTDDQLLGIMDSLLLPTLFDSGKTLSNWTLDSFYRSALSRLQELKETFLSGVVQLEQSEQPEKTLEGLVSEAINSLESDCGVIESWVEFFSPQEAEPDQPSKPDTSNSSSVLPADYIEAFNSLMQLIDISSVFKRDASDIKSVLGNCDTILSYDSTTIKTPDLKAIIDNLKNMLEAIPKMSVSASDELKLLAREQQLLNDIQHVDVNRDFYYTATLEPSLAINFNKSNPALNTLMSSSINYDINNVNNSFVISKLDINYLSDGLQIAHSSRLN